MTLLKINDLVLLDTQILEWLESIEFDQSTPSLGWTLESEGFSSSGTLDFSSITISEDLNRLEELVLAN